MKVSVLKRDRRIEVEKSTSYGIQTYGKGNDYPQMLLEVLSASITGKSCVKRYADFLNGNGFSSPDFAKLKANSRQETFNDILRSVAYDYATFGGFALLVNYNANDRISSVYAVPFEQVRLDLPDEKGHVGGFALHPDWGKRNVSIKPFRAEDIVRVARYEPIQEIIDGQVAAAGGYLKYTGQLFYFSRDGKETYPLPIYDVAVTDMNTEEGISNITNRNARNNFLPSGMLVDICQVDKTEDEKDSTQELLRKYQGDTNALKLIYAQVGTEAEVPRFVEFKTNNFDKEYTESRNATKDNIGRCFNQPPILRAEQTASGFSTTEMVSAYNYYNSITTSERSDIERVFAEIMSHWFEIADYDVSIAPLSYNAEQTEADRIGANFPQLLAVIESGTLTDVQKRGIARALFGLSEAQINQILPI